jgi:hypothetical protein
VNEGRNDIDEKYEVNNNTDNNAGKKECGISRNIPSRYLKTEKTHKEWYGYHNVSHGRNSE